MQPFLQLKSKKYYTLWVCVCSLMYPACNAHAPYCHLWHVRLYNIFSTLFHIIGTIFEKLFELKCFLIFFIMLVRNISHFKKEWARYDKTIYWCSCKVQLLLTDFNETWIFSTNFQKSNQLPNFMITVYWKASWSMRRDGRTEGQTGRQTDRRKDGRRDGRTSR